MKKALSLILMLVMVFSALVPSMVLAADEIDASSHVNVAAGKSYTTTAIYTTNGVQNWPDEGGVTLTDGAKASADAGFDDPVWVGFNKQSADYDSSENGYGATTVIDLGASTELSKVAFQAFGGAAGISVPYWINLYVSDDGETYTFAKYLEINTDNAVAGVNAYELDIDVTARFVKVCFYGYGWIFIDEIEIYGEDINAPVEPEVQKTFENTLVKGEDGNYSSEVPYGYTWSINYIDGTIVGEDNTICTTQDAYNACNPDWAITVYAELQEDGTYVALKDAIATPGSAANAGITIGENQIAIVAHSAYSNPNGSNWESKIAAVSVKAGDVFVVDMDAMTVYAVIPGEEIVVPEPEHKHNLVHVAAVAAGCHYDGNIEHWYCTDCETVWADEALTQVTNHKSVIVPATGSDLLVAMDAVEPGCHYNGNEAYWICYECEQVWADEALTQLTNIKNVTRPALGGETVHVEAVEPTYTELGNVEHWYCEECGQVWTDEACTQLTNRFNVILPTLIHSVTVNVSDLPILTDGKTGFDGNWGTVGTGDVHLISNSMCRETGMEVVILYDLGEVKGIDSVALHFYHCAGVMIGYPEGSVILEVSVDGENYETVGYYDLAAADLANGKYGTVVTTCEFDAVKAAYVRATVYAGSSVETIGNENGEVADGKVFWEFISLAEVEITEAHVHELVHVEAVDAGCHYTGNIEHWYCTDCETVWADEALTQVANHKSVVLPELGGDIIHVDAVAPTYTELGNIEYWYCESCEQVWQDEARTQLTNLKNVILPTLPIPNLAAGKEWYGDTDVGSGYVGNLTDGIIDPEGKYDTTIWYGADNRKATDGVFTMIIDLGALYDISDTNIHVWPAGYSGIMIPGSIDFYVSEDGENFVLVESITEYDGTSPQWVGTSADVTARYVRIDMTNGDNNGVFWFASEIEIYGIENEHKHNLVHMEAVEAGCHYDGNIEHWYCTDCETVWADEALTQVTNHKNVIIPATGEGNLVHMEAVEPGCHYEGNIEYWVCSDCEQVWQDEALTQLTNIKNVVLPELGGEVVHVEAVANGCGVEGNIEHWYCEECGQVWADEARTQLTNIKNVVLPALEHEIVHMEAVDAGCHYDGNTEHWYCTNCETVWADEALTQITNHKSVILPELGGEVVHVEAVANGCGVEGNIEYWYCEECGQVWQDEARTQLTNIKNVVLPALEHEIVHMEAVEAGCHYTGNTEHWYCTLCETVWADEALTQITNHKSVILPATGEGNLVHMEAVEAGCHYDGNIEHWYCTDCETVWADEALTQVTNHKNVIIPATGEGNLVHMEAVEPGCHYEGNIEYWICYECEQVWADEALTKLTNIKSVVVPALGGEVVHVEAVANGCGVEGNIEYWICEECEQVWQDEALTQLTNIKNVVLPALEHEFDANGDCVNCDAKSDLLVSVLLEKETYKAGETFDVVIMLDRNNGFAHLSLDVLFDTDVFELVGVSNGAIIENFANGLHYVWSAAENATETGALVTLTLKVKTGATVGNYEIKVVCNEAWNSDELPVSIALSGSNVEIEKLDAIYGDVNGDGKITGTDVTRLLRYIANRDPFTSESSVEVFAGADVNGDGKINGTDVTRLLRFIANRDPVTSESSIVLGPTAE